MRGRRLLHIRRSHNDAEATLTAQFIHRGGRAVGGAGKDAYVVRMIVVRVADAILLLVGQ